MEDFFWGKYAFLAMILTNLISVFILAFMAQQAVTISQGCAEQRGLKKLLKFVMVSTDAPSSPQWIVDRPYYQIQIVILSACHRRE